MSTVGCEWQHVGHLQGPITAAGDTERVQLLECGVCHSLVRSEAAGDHTGWHAEEGHLRP